MASQVGETGGLMAVNAANRLGRRDLITAPEGAGLVLCDVRLKPLYVNAAARRILVYPKDSREVENDLTPLHQRLRLILGIDQLAAASESVDFYSGRRRYFCRPFVLDSPEARPDSPVMALLFERLWPEAVVEAARRFHLTPRERETVQYLVHGLTTKEVAQRMHISPNTVKQFVRLTMNKMGVTTRCGIVGKLMAGSGSNH